MKPRNELGFGEKVESRRELSEEHYLTCREKVKSGFKRTFKLSPTLRQPRNLAKFTCKNDHDPAGFAEVGHSQDQALGLLARHVIHPFRSNRILHPSPECRRPETARGQVVQYRLPLIVRAEFGL